MSVLPPIGPVDSILNHNFHNGPFTINSYYVMPKIIHDKGDFNGDNCLLFSNDTIVINKHKPLEQRLYVLAKCFSQINLENVYIKPLLRDLINQAKTDKVYD